MSNSPPAWHPDPSDPNFLRWWDGTQWTSHTHPLTGPAEQSQSKSQSDDDAHAGWQAGTSGQPQVPGVYSSPQPGYPSQYPGGTGGFPTAGQGGGGAFPSQYGGFPGGTVRAGGPTMSGWQALRHSNRFSVTAIIFAAIYVVLAVTVHFVLIGIVPVMSSVRAFQNKEKLAPISAIAAVVVVVVFLVYRHL